MSEKGSEPKSRDITSVVPFEDKPIVSASDCREDTRVEDVSARGIDETIEIDNVTALPVLNPKKKLRLREGVVGVFSFVCIMLAFVAVFFGIGVLIIGDKPDTSGDTSDSTKAQTDDETLAVGGVPQTQPEESSSSSELSDKAVFVVDESSSGIFAEDIDTSSYSLSELIEGKEGVKIIIIHSHSSEMFSENIGIVEAGDVLGELLKSSGIGVYHERKSFDSEGTIGAYGRMETALAALLEKYPETVCVIDLHDSDMPSPLTITVGAAGSRGITDNLPLALAVYRRYDGVKSTLRILPSSVGQSHSRLSLHIGIGGAETSDKDARAALAAFAEGLLRVCLSEYK